uniref:Putative ovule protein n=1 Tax=Solanum chacoense TaxID=4108 RepID=A0A0V0H904_SOLCH
MYIAVLNLQRLSYLRRRSIKGGTVLLHTQESRRSVMLGGEPIGLKNYYWGAIELSYTTPSVSLTGSVPRMVSFSAVGKAINGCKHHKQLNIMIIISA